MFITHGFPAHDNPDHGFPDHRFSAHEFPDHGFPAHEFPDHGFSAHDFPDHGFLDHGSHTVPEGNIFLVIRFLIMNSPTKTKIQLDELYGSKALWNSNDT